MESLARLVPFVWPQRRRLLMSFVLAGVVALLWAGALLLVFPVVKLMLQGQSLHQYVEEEQLAVGEYGWLVTRLMPLIPADRFELLAWVMLACLALTGLKCWAGYVQETMVGSIVQRTMQTLRERLFRRTLQLDQQTLALETTPQLMSRFTFDLQQVSLGLTLLGSKAVLEPLKAVVCVALAFGVNWRLTALSFVCAPLAAWLFGNFGRRLKQASRRQMESMSRVYRVLNETLTSFRLVLAFRNERLHRRQLSRENRDYYQKAMKIVRIDALANPSVEFLAMFAVFLASLPGAYLVLRHKTSIWGVRLAAQEMDVAQLALLYTLLAGVLDPARKLANVYSKVKKAAAACDRIFGWMDHESLLADAAEPLPVPRHRDAIEFDHVTFRYAAAADGVVRPVSLDDVSVRIPFGATVAIVGGNGSGKSTLVNLLPRFFDPQSGTVRIDGFDIRDVDPRSLRSQIGLVTQETLLFDRSISDNIEYSKPGASLTEIEDAARRAHVLSFVQQMPDGMNTHVGDRGHRLSGGQRQRVSLARAILRNPAILILDEATSAVDAQSEQLIHETLRDFAKGRTTLIVTHAMSSTLLEFVTHVLVMDQGRAIALGAHSDVLATCPVYQRLFTAQTHRRAA